MDRATVEAGLLAPLSRVLQVRGYQRSASIAGAHEACAAVFYRAGAIFATESIQILLQAQLDHWMLGVKLMTASRSPSHLAASPAAPPDWTGKDLFHYLVHIEKADLNEIPPQIIELRSLEDVASALASLSHWIPIADEGVWADLKRVDEWWVQYEAEQVAKEALQRSRRGLIGRLTAWVKGERS